MKNFVVVFPCSTHIVKKKKKKKKIEKRYTHVNPYGPPEIDINDLRAPPIYTLPPSLRSHGDTYTHVCALSSLL